jgi:MinD-like ATPase involved in chromosome partitioning or flagellar assembly
VIAIDANPDRGTLAERVSKSTRFTVRDVVNRAAAIDGFTEFSTMVSRDTTRLDVLASDSDPMLSEAFDEGDYNVVADMAARYYSVVLTDCGTGIVHSVMRPTLQRASGLVIVSGGSVDEARLASETLTWLEANGYGDLVRNSIVAALQDSCSRRCSNSLRPSFGGRFGHQVQPTSPSHSRSRT